MIEKKIEEKITFSKSEKIFYNPKMRLCRSISSLAVGAIKEEIDVIDAFCATGIRGIRYSKENENVKSLAFVDIEKEAISIARKNARKNLLKGKFINGNISNVAFEIASDFVEIDPFGTPSPYLVDAMRFFNPKKRGYLSVTATDVAVLCGAKLAPCLKNYHSKPLNNEFTHETGLRIMIKRIAEVAAEFNFGITPLVSFSDKHYLKSIIKLERSADKAFESMKSLGYLSYNKQNGSRHSSLFPVENYDYAGQLWLGEIHQSEFLKSMIELNEKRNYSDYSEIKKLLMQMESEILMPPFYYNVHNLCRIFGVKHVPSMKHVLDRLTKKGFKAFRTHFSKISFKTNAPIELIKEVFYE